MSVKRIPAGQGFTRLSEAVTTEYASLLELVRAALRDKLRATPGVSDYYLELSGIWPDRVVAKVQGRFMSFPYTLDTDNKVVLAEGKEVVLDYTAVREASGLADPAATFREAADGSIAVTIIRAGASINGNYYTDASLQGAVQLFEGVRVFSKSDADHTKGAGKDVRNLIGGIYGVSFVAGSSADTGSLVGTFRPIDPTDAVVTKMTEAVKRGMQGLMGLSIDAEAYTKKQKVGGRQMRVAKSFAKVHSVDLIVEPGAGGGLDRLTEATTPPSDNGETMLKTRMYEAIKAKNKARAAEIDLDTITDDELLKVYEAVCGNAGSGAAAAGADGTTKARVSEADAGDDAPVTRAQLALHNARFYASTAIAVSTLPQVAKDRLQADFKVRERFTEAEVDSAIKSEREYLARFTESGRPTGGMPRIEVGDRTVAVKDMLDAFFDPKHKDHRSVRSFRECYVEITGDREITGRPDRVRLTESIGTDTFADALGNSITRRMQAEYRDAVAWDAWRQVVSVANVADFRVQERTQIGGYGDLPVVAERGNYTTLSDPSDDKALYQVAKRGGLAQVTMEAIANDDVQAIRRIPIELGRGAKRTLYSFVFNFFAANPVTYDGLALYHATHGNLLTGALSAAQISAHRLAMKKQPGRDTGKRMGIGPRFLLVPDDLEEASADIFRRNTNNDKTFVQSLTLDIIPVSTWTDTNDWVSLADPLDLPVIEIGFWNGEEEPTLLTQNGATEGSVFTNDVISYKVRHVYGGNVLVDGFKGTTKAVVP